MFITRHLTRVTTSINLAHVVSAKRLADAHALWQVIDTDGNEHQVDDVSLDLALETTPTATFPAAPGTSKLWMFDGEDGRPAGYDRTTIIGWGIFADGETRPVTIDVEGGTDDARYYVEHPNGRVEGSHTLQRWADADSWYADQMKDRDSGRG